ncbi:3-keto-disaccharide hydrolase [Larkinella sp. VNQ87]|uniref:3-keto-disaccharide hydrolase n=1 Tax=Larkinella sp. VNQ87 TaxID=3400921 RepID=UPI003BFC4375
MVLLALILTVVNTSQTLASGPKKGKWVKLFDGKSFAGWHTYLKQGQPVSDKWQVEDGAIALTGRGGGDLVTDQEFENYELELEWKISEKGNSGIIYRVHEDPKFKATYQTGPEMQVLDNERHPDAKAGKNGNRTSGSLYDMLPPSDFSAQKVAGEWNKVRLVVNKGKVEHYLNGKKVVEYQTSGPEWEKMVNDSKFKGWEGFNKFDKGRIALQDHGDKVWYRNIRIREL